MQVEAVLRLGVVVLGVGGDAPGQVLAGGGQDLARTRELRNSLIPWGEQRFPRYIGRDRVKMPRLDAICWNKKAEWVAKKCGAQDWPPAVGVGIANR